MEWFVFVFFESYFLFKLFIKCRVFGIYYFFLCYIVYSCLVILVIFSGKRRLLILNFFKCLI